MHVSLIPEEAAQHATSIFTGDAEAVWLTVIADVRCNELKPRYHGESSIPQSGRVTRRDLYAGKGYLPISLLQFGRCCRFRCEFCAVSEYFGACNYTRPVEEVVAEIRAQKRKDLFFVDDNLILMAAGSLVPV